MSEKTELRGKSRTFDKTKVLGSYVLEVLETTRDRLLGEVEPAGKNGLWRKPRLQLERVALVVVGGRVIGLLAGAYHVAKFTLPLPAVMISSSSQKPSRYTEQDFEGFGAQTHKHKTFRYIIHSIALVDVSPTPHRVQLIVQVLGVAVFVLSCPFLDFHNNWCKPSHSSNAFNRAIFTAQLRLLH